MIKIKILLLGLVYLGASLKGEVPRKYEISVSEKRKFLKNLNGEGKPGNRELERHLIISFTYTEKEILSATCIILPGSGDGPQSSFLLWRPEKKEKDIQGLTQKINDAVKPSLSLLSLDNFDEFLSKASFYYVKNVFYVQVPDERNKIFNEIGFKKNPFEMLWWKTKSERGTSARFFRRLSKAQRKEMLAKVKFFGGLEFKKWEDIGNVARTWTELDSNIGLACPDLKFLLEKRNEETIGKIAGPYVPIK